MSAPEAAALVARAAVEMTGALTKKSSGALRQQRYRERNKASQSVTQSADESVTNRNEGVTRDAQLEASQTVTNRNEVTLCDSASLSKKEKKESKKRERGSQIADGWKPDDARWAEAIDRLGSVARAEAELRKFTNHALSKGRVCKNWNAAWANWVDRALEWGSGNGNSNLRTNPAAGRATAREAEHVATMGGAALRYLQAGKAAGPSRDLPGGAGSAEVFDLGKRAENAR
jgi:hypothetical protein